MGRARRRARRRDRAAVSRHHDRRRAAGHGAALRWPWRRRSSAVTDPAASAASSNWTAYYAAHAGFGLAFETLVARELCDFCNRLDSARDGLWLAVQDGRIEGSIAIDGARADTEGAHLRWFIVADAVRGRGVGGALLEAAMTHCRDRGFDRVVLWTFDGLHAARHLYEKAGFRLAHQQRGARWGREVDEQRFEWCRHG